MLLISYFTPPLQGHRSHTRSFKVGRCLYITEMSALTIYPREGLSICEMLSPHCSPRKAHYPYIRGNRVPPPSTNHGQDVHFGLEQTSVSSCPIMCVSLLFFKE